MNEQLQINATLLELIKSLSERVDTLERELKYLQRKDFEDLKYIEGK